jgi:hypothetical protein
MTYQQQLNQLLADPAAMAASLAHGMRLSEEQQRDFSNAAAELATSHFNAAAAAAAAAAADFNAAAAAAAAEQAAVCTGPSGSPLLPPSTAAMLCGLGGDSCHQSDGSKSPTSMDGAAAANAAAAAAAAMAAMAQGMPLPPLPGLQGLLGGLPPGMNPAALQSLAKTAGLFPGAPMPQFPSLPGFGGPLGGMPGMPGADAFAGPLFAGLPGMKAAPAPPPAVPNSSRKSLDSVLHAGGNVATGRRSSENPAIQSVRAGPRIFIGKLTKDTSEADVKEYFGRFGFVMDVYMPKAKDNKAEHRGFGFVTFETDAAIKRVVGAGTHKLKGSTIAIDIAMPKLDEEVGLDSFGGGAGAGMQANNGLAGLGGMGRGPLGNGQSFDAMAAGMMAAAAAAQQYNVRSSLPIM